MPSVKLNPSTISHREELRCFPLGKKLGVIITSGNWYPPNWCRTQKRRQLPENVLGMNIIRKTSPWTVLPDCPTVLSKEFVAVDVNVKALIMADRDISVIIDADSDDENE
ncbi:hypothetical protein TNCV_2430781 [Trichonephila clavipes]|nr:hypothetical protein TNCV_2430781 [Trichonephila clavipes]